MQPSVFRALAVQVRVIGALILREMTTRYGRDNLGFLWIIGEPILFCGGVTIAWTAIRPAHEHGLPMTAIVITGYMPLTMWRHCLFRSVKAFESNGSLLFHRQVTPLDIITGRCVLEVMGTLAAGLIVTTGAILTGYMDPPYDLGLVFLGLGYQAFFGYATALIFASLSEMSDLVEKAISVFAYLSLPFSGAFTMVSWVPKNFQFILLWSPSVHNTEMIRAGVFGPTAHAVYDVAFDTWVTAALLLVGLYLTLRVRRFLVIH